MFVLTKIFVVHLCLQKLFVVCMFNFCGLADQQKYFNSEHFSNYGMYTVHEEIAGSCFLVVNTWICVDLPDFTSEEGLPTMHNCLITISSTITASYNCD